MSIENRRFHQKIENGGFTMKKLIAFAVTMLLLLGMLTACSPTSSSEPNVSGTDKKESSSSSTSSVGSGQTGVPTTSGQNQTTNIFQGTSTEFYDFSDAFTSMEETYDTLFTDDEAVSADMDALTESIYRMMPAGQLASLIEFDELKDGGGVLPMSGFEGNKEISGDEIKISVDYTFATDVSTYQAGDRLTQKGVLNRKTQTLTFESIVENGGKIKERIILEGAILPDSTRIFQYIAVTSQLNISGTDSATKIAVFKRFNQDSYSAITAVFDQGYDFTYQSLVGKDDLTPDQMAKGYQVKGRFSVENGKAAFKNE
jgi:hypothetical protein